MALAEYTALRMDGADAASVLRTRGRWPVGTRARLEFGSLKRASPALTPWTVVVEQRGGARGSMREGAEPPNWRPPGGLTGLPFVDYQSIDLPASAPGTYRERVLVSVVSDGSTIGRWKVVVPYEVVATLDEAVPPRDSPEIRERIARGLRAEESRWGEITTYRIVVTGPIEGLGEVRLHGDVLVDGRVVGKIGHEGCFWLNPVPRGEHDVEWAADNVPAFRHTARLRLTGDQKAALGDFGAQGYWSGTMEVSLADILNWGDGRNGRGSRW